MSAKIILRHASHDSFYALTAYDCRRPTELFGIEFDENMMNLMCKVANDLSFEEKLSIDISKGNESFGLVHMGEYYSRTFLVERRDSKIDFTLFQHGAIQRTQFDSVNEMLIEDADDIDNLVAALSKLLFGQPELTVELKFHSRNGVIERSHSAKRKNLQSTIEDFLEFVGYADLYDAKEATKALLVHGSYSKEKLSLKIS